MESEGGHTLCFEDFYPLHVLLPRVWSRPPSRSQPCLPPRCKVNQRRVLVEVRNEKPRPALEPSAGPDHPILGNCSATRHISWRNASSWRRSYHAWDAERTLGRKPLDESQTMRVTVEEAAQLLGIEKQSVKKRIQRGKLRSERDGVGTTFVYVDASETVRDEPEDGPGAVRDELLESLREQIGYLQGVIATRDRELALRAEEIRRRDTALEREQQLTAFFAERLRELKAPAHDAAPEASEEAPQSPKSPGRSDTLPDRGGGPESATDEQQGRGPIPEASSPQGATERPQEERSWWRRMFGG